MGRGPQRCPGVLVSWSFLLHVCLWHSRKEGTSPGVLLPSGISRYRTGRRDGSSCDFARRRSCPPIFAFAHHFPRCAVLPFAALRDGIAGPLESPTGSFCARLAGRRSCRQLGSMAVGLPGWLAGWQTRRRPVVDAGAFTNPENPSRLVHLIQITWNSGLSVSWGWACHRCVACGSAHTTWSPYAPPATNGTHPAHAEIRG